MLFGFELHVDHVGGSVPPPFYMLENAPQLDVVRSMANTEPCTLYSGRNLQKHRRGQSVLSERCERSAKPLPLRIKIPSIQSLDVAFFGDHPGRSPTPMSAPCLA